MQTCAVLNFQDQRIEYYDSLGGVHEPTISSLLQWVEDEYVDKYKQPLPDKFKVRLCLVSVIAVTLNEF
jgi:Ulp1 family protease